MQNISALKKWADRLVNHEPDATAYVVVSLLNGSCYLSANTDFVGAVKSALTEGSMKCCIAINGNDMTYLFDDGSGSIVNLTNHGIWSASSDGERSLVGTCIERGFLSLKSGLRKHSALYAIDCDENRVPSLVSGVIGDKIATIHYSEFVDLIGVDERNLSAFLAKGNAIDVLASTVAPSNFEDRLAASATGTLGLVW